MTIRAGFSVKLHHPSHADLLDTRFRPRVRIVPPRIDAIVVPTARPAEYLRAVAELARQMGCLLVVLCSVRAVGRAVAELVAGHAGLQTAVVDLPRDYEHRLLRFSTSRHELGGFKYHVDLSTKRNLGLLLANLLGWRQLLFIDDDMRELDVCRFARASLLLERYRAVGFRVREYPDNSVVCHAHRLAGGAQDTFIGGSPLLVDVAAARSFFPAVYNEDWFFLFDSLKARAVTAAGKATQLEYDPFGSPARATAEEFGDVVGEGLFRLLHAGADVNESSPSLWRDLLRLRSAFIDEICDGLLTTEHDRGLIAQPALKALAAARGRLEDISPGACHSFVERWQKDRAKWSERMLRLPRFTSVRKALRHLDLSPVNLEVPRWRRSTTR